MELAGLGSIQPYALWCYMSNRGYIAHTHYNSALACDALVVVIKSRQYEVGFFLLVSGSFEPLAPEPQVAHKLAKGTKEKRQTEGDEEYGERKDDNRRDAAPFIRPNRGPCCTT